MDAPEGVPLVSPVGVPIELGTAGSAYRFGWLHLPDCPKAAARALYHPDELQLGCSLAGKDLPFRSRFSRNSSDKN